MDVSEDEKSEEEELQVAAKERRAFNTEIDSLMVIHSNLMRVGKVRIL